MNIVQLFKSLFLRRAAPPLSDVPEECVEHTALIWSRILDIHVTSDNVRDCVWRFELYNFGRLL